MRRTITGTQRGIRLCIAHSSAMQTSDVSTLANTRSQSSKISLNESGVSCLKRYRPISASKPTNTNILVTQTKTIWLRYFGDGLLANRSLARIALRASSGEEPTEAQLAEKCEAIRPSVVRRALAEGLQYDIRRAFNRGEEVRSLVLLSPHQRC